MSTPLLSVENLKVFFPSKRGSFARVVDGVSFDIKNGETVCIVGESGCGKTVTALSILGLVHVPPAMIPEGRITFRGQDILGLDEEKMRSVRGRHIAMVFQEPLTSLNPVFTIGYQIKEAIKIHNNVGKEEIHKRCIDLLRDVGIPSPEQRMSAYPHQLSGGQRQRVMIAMALSCNPALIIADEPTTALDVTIQAQILNLFSRIQKQHGMSLLYISHDIGVVANVADRVYVMYAGTVMEQGSVTEIFESPVHPYTRGLLASLPDRSQRGKRLYSIPGMVPDPSDKPKGCPFHPRCPDSMEKCAVYFPDEMYSCGNGHLVRCHLVLSP